MLATISLSFDTDRILQALAGIHGKIDAIEQQVVDRNTCINATTEHIESLAGTPRQSRLPSTSLFDGIADRPRREGDAVAVSSNMQSNNVLRGDLVYEFEHGSALQINPERTPSRGNLCVTRSDQVLSHLNRFVAHKVFDCAEVDQFIVDDPIDDDLVIAGTNC